MPVGRAAHRAERLSLSEPVLGESEASAGLDLLELVEYAWHDCYREIAPPDDVIVNILICSRGNLAEMARAAKLAVVDWRDLQLRAEQVQGAACVSLWTHPRRRGAAVHRADSSFTS